MTLPNVTETRADVEVESLDERILTIRRKRREQVLAISGDGPIRLVQKLRRSGAAVMLVRIHPRLDDSVKEALISTKETEVGALIAHLSAGLPAEIVDRQRARLALLLPKLIWPAEPTTDLTAPSKA